MSLILSGTDGVSDVDGTAATPALRGSDTNTGIFFPAADTIAFAEGGVESARLDSAGNLGLGVTPSAWSSYRALQLAGGGSLVSFGNAAEVWSNAFFNGSSNLYIANGFATRYHANNNGAHAWYTAPSGTAGNAISFTQAMTLDASGNLLVNMTSAPGTAAKLLAAGTGNLSSTTVTRANTAGAYLRDTAGTNNTGVGVWFDQGSLLAGIASSRVNTVTWGTDLRFYTHPDATSNVDEVYERARIDSSGNLLVNQTSPNSGAKFCVTNTGSTNFVGFTRGTDRGIHVDVTATAGIAMYFTTSSATVQAGLISVSTNTAAYTSGSDYRLKDNVRPLTNALDKVAALRPVAFEWKADGTYGESFIAHELAEVCPQAVVGEKDAVDADGNPQYQGIDTSFLVATLTAAIKEQQAIIEQLTTRIAALEAK